MNSDDRDFGCLIGAIIIVAFVTVAGLVWLMNQAGVGSEMAAIEQLRADAAVVDASQAEDVIGQVTDANQRIVSNRQFDSIPLVGIMVPDEWSRVAVIPVPTEP